MGIIESLLYKRMAELRAEKGWTQAQLAEKIGVTRQTCGNYESRNRLPDVDVLMSLCTVFGVSADYLIGLSDTRRPEYANIAQTTGLSETSINYLRNSGSAQRGILNCLLAEEPVSPPWSAVDNDPAYEAYLSSPAQLDAAYQRQLKSLEEDGSKASILDHLADEWGYRDHIEAETPEEYAARIAKENAEAAVSAQEEADAMAAHYANIDPSAFGPVYATSAEAENAEQEMLERERKYIEAEEKKSNLLTAISNYVAYTAGCQLETDFGSEELTCLHTIRIGTGRGNAITFPSQKGDELLEFMLLQKVIDALKAFKNNYIA